MFTISKGIRLELSYDKYHLAELDRIKVENRELYYKYVANIRRLIDSKYFVGSRGIDNLIDAGRAQGLEGKKSESICTPIFYASVNTALGKCTALSYYGNILTEDLDAILNGSKI